MSVLFTPAQESAIAEATKAYCRRARDLRCRVKAIEILDAETVSYTHLTLPTILRV